MFDALKFNKFNSRFEKASTELTEERPLRQALEATLMNLNRQHATEDKRNFLRSVCIRMSGIKYRGFQVWKEYVAYYNRVKQRVKSRIIELNKRNQADALARWKKGTDKKQVRKMMEMADEFSNENAELSTQIRHLDDQVKKYADCSGRRAT